MKARIKWIGHLTRAPEHSNVKVFLEEPCRKRPLGRPQRRYWSQNLGVNDWRVISEERDSIRFSFGN